MHDSVGVVRMCRLSRVSHANTVVLQETDIQEGGKTAIFRDKEIHKQDGFKSLLKLIH